MGTFTRAGLALAALALTGCADPFIEATVELGDTRDTEGPYQVWTIVVGSERSDQVELRYTVDGGGEVSARMRRTDDGGDDPGELYRGAIVGQDRGSTIAYTIAVEREGEVVAVDPADGDPPFVFSITP